MVNRGKPSKGCDSCRKRKIKCDEGRPICAQCQRSNRTCNFRDQLDLLFVHQNRDDVKVASEKRVSKSNASARRTARQTKHASKRDHATDTVTMKAVTSTTVECNSNRPSRLIANEGRLQASKQVPRALSNSMADQAITFFLKHYVVSNGITTRGQYEYLPSMCAETGADPLLQLSVMASGMAALANVFASSELSIQARHVYDRAICMAQAAINSPTRVVKDSTLLSVLLLGRFEGITQRDKSQKDVWSIHLSGAAKIITLRGMNQFRSAVGRQIFQLYFSFLLVDKVTNRAPMREDMLAIRERAAPMYDTSSPEWRLSSINIGLAQFYAEVQGNRAPSPQYVLSTALDLDSQLVELADDMYATSAWRYHIVSLEHGRSHDFAYHGFYHIYNEYWMAQVWNSLRGVRLLLNEIIVKFLTASAERYPSMSHVPQDIKIQYQKSWATLNQMTIEICASIPQYMGQLPETGTRRSSLVSSIHGDTVSWPVPKTFVAPTGFEGKPLSPLSIALSSPMSSNTSSPHRPSTTSSRSSISTVPSLQHDPIHPSTYHHPLTPPPESHNAPQALPSLDPSPSVGQAVNFFLWPLFVTGMVSSTPPKLRLWIMSQLQLVGKTNGNRQADALAFVLRHQEPGGITGFSLWRDEEDQKHVDIIGI